MAVDFGVGSHLGSALVPSQEIGQGSLDAWGGGCGHKYSGGIFAVCTSLNDGILKWGYTEK